MSDIDHDLTDFQLSLIRFIACGEIQTPRIKDVAHFLNTSSSAVARALNEMYGEYMHADPGRGEDRSLFLTDEGKELASSLWPDQCNYSSI